MALDEPLSEAAGQSGEIHQSLHGYRDGHRLLALSIPLPQAALDAMLSLTDAVDVYDNPAFPALLAVYPLPETPLIAASLTWPATDVGRAGAVWTHTLITNANTLGSTGAALFELFRRPSSTTTRELERYGRHLSPDFAGAEEVSPAFLEVSSRIAWALHESPPRPVIADASDLPPGTRQRLVIGLVAQCWPRLAQSLACGEASGLPRFLGRRPFDLTLTSARGISGFPHAFVDRPRVMPASTHIRSPQWAKLLAREALRPDGLTDFLCRFGPAAQDDRAAVKPLARIYNELSEIDPVVGLRGALHVLASAFPRRSDMAELKIAIFGAREDYSLRPSISEVEILVMLLMDPHARCLSTVDLRLAERSANLAASSSDDVRELLRTVLAQGKLPDSAKAVCAGLVAGISGSDLRDLSHEHPELIAALVDVNPAALERPELWEASPIAFLNMLDQRVSDPARRVMIAARAARAANHSLARQLLEIWPKEIESDLSKILTSSAALDIWADVLPARTLAAWLAPQKRAAPSQILKVASKLTAAQAGLVPSDVWLRVTPTIGNAAFDERAFATLLCIAVKNNEAAGAELACGTTTRLWQAIVGHSLERGDVLLDLGRLTNRTAGGDIAEGLIQRLVKCFNKHKWPVVAALQLRDLDAFRRLLETDAEPRSGGSIAQRLLSRLPPSASAEQVAIMEDVVKHYAPREDLVHLLEGLIRRFTYGG